MADGTTVDSLQIEIEASSAEAEKKVDALAAALERLKKATTGFGSIGDRIKDIGTAASDTPAATKGKQRREALDRVVKPEAQTIATGIDLEKAGSQIDATDKKIEKAKSSIAELNEQIRMLGFAHDKEQGAQIIDQLNEKLTEQQAILDGLIQKREKLSTMMLDGAAQKQPEAQLKDIKWKDSKVEIVESEESLQKKRRIIQSIKELIDNFKPVKLTDTNQTKDIKLKVDSSDLDKATRKAGRLKNIVDPIKRIAFYRTIRSALKMVTDGFRTGIENLYQYSAIMGTELKPAMDQIATSSLYLKNSLGAMVAPLIQALAPAIDFVVDKFVALLNIINQVFAALSGSDYYTKAIKQIKEYAGATNGAAKSLQSFLLGIDELNVIDKTSGGGGGAATPDYSTMFEEEKIGGPAKKIAEILKEILPYVDKIAAGFAGWMIASKLFSDLGKLQTMLGGLMVGVGITLLIDSIKDILFGDGLTWDNILKGGAGGAIAGGGFGLLFAKKLGLTWAKGMLGGAIIGLGLSLIAMSVAAQIRDGLNLENALLGMLGGALVGGMAGRSLAFKLNIDKSRGIIGGIIAGIGLTLFLSALNDIKENGLDIGNAILTAVGGALAGAGIGWTLGGPGGALIGATIGIGISLIAAWFTAETSKPPTDFIVEMNEVIDRSKAATERATAAVDNLKDSVKNLDTVSADFAVARRLVDAIFDINEKAVITDTEFETMKTLIDALNNMNIDGLSLSIDETTGRVREAKESVEELIASLEKEARVEALQDILVQSYKDQYQALLDANQAAKDYADNIEILGQMQRGEIQLTLPELAALGGAIQANEEAYYANRDAVIELGNAQDGITKELVALQGEFDDTGAAVDNYTNGVDENLVRSSSDIDEYVSRSKISLDGLSGGVQKTGSEINSSISGHLADILTETSNKWGNIKQTIDTTVADIKSNTGTQFDEMKTNTHNTFEDIKTQAGADSEAVANRIRDPIEKVAKESKQWGQDICNNLASGMRKGLQGVADAASSVARQIKDRLHFSEPDIGPLSDFHTYMPDMMSLMAKGIKDNSYLAVNAVSDLADTMSKKLGDIEPVEPRYSNVPNRAFSFSIADIQPRGDVPNYSAQSDTGNDKDHDSALINAFYAAAGMIVEAIQNQDIGVYLDAKQLMQSVERSQRQRGADIMGGGVLY